MISEAKLAWDQPLAGSTGEAATWGHLRVTHGGDVLWSAAPGSNAPGIHWTWIDLLEFLGANWPWLMGEDAWPPSLVLSDLHPAAFDEARRRAMEGATPAVRRRIDATLFEFRDRHDLSLGLRGKVAPRFWFVRQGAEAWLGGATAVKTGWDDAVGLLVGLGDAIANRIALCDDERAVAARAMWAERDECDPTQRAEALLGVDAATVARVAGTDPAAVLELPARGFEPSELAFAARLAAPSLAQGATRRILDCIRSAPFTPPSKDLTALARQAAASVDTSATAFDQGFALGRWFRSEVGPAPDIRAEPEAILTKWGISCSTIALGDAGVDAVACWGKRHGPAVFVNSDGRHAQSDAGRRATVAHEIAHLLLDRERALPLSELQGAIFRGRFEQRANAFAAELLMPQEVAGAAFAVCKTETDAEDVLQELRIRYGASGEVIAWQAVNSGVDLPRVARDVLAAEVRPDRRWRFLAE